MVPYSPDVVVLSVVISSRSPAVSLVGMAAASASSASTVPAGTGFVKGIVPSYLTFSRVATAASCPFAIRCSSEAYVAV